MIDRAERTGFGVALGGHVLLFAILLVGVGMPKPPVEVQRAPVEVQLVDEVALDSGAPEISHEAPAPKLAEVEGPVEPVAEPVPVEPAPVPKPAPPQPKVAVKPAPAKPAKPVKPAVKAQPAPQKPAPAARPARPTGRLAGLLEGVSDTDSPSRSRTPPAATISPAVQSSLAAAVLRQLRPHWKPPTGADSDQLRTELRISLARDGTVTDIDFIRQTGITASNRPQAALHKEQAMKAVRLASPFQLPAQYYDAWKQIGPIGFDARLSR